MKFNCIILKQKILCVSSRIFYFTGCDRSKGNPDVIFELGENYGSEYGKYNF